LKNVPISLSQYFKAAPLGEMAAPWINIIFKKLWKKYSLTIKNRLLQSIHPKIASALIDGNFKKALFTVEEIEMGTKVLCCYFIFIVSKITFYFKLF